MRPSSPGGCIPRTPARCATAASASQARAQLSLCSSAPVHFCGSPAWWSRASGREGSDVSLQTAALRPLHSPAMQHGRALVLAPAQQQQQQLVPSGRGGGGQQLGSGSRALGGASTIESHVVGLEKSLAAEGTHINKLHDVIKEVRSKVFSLQDVVVQSRIKLVKQEEQTAAERSKVEIKVHLAEERQRLVEELSTEHAHLLAAETALLNEEAAHTAEFLRNLTANEALIRGLHSLSPPGAPDSPDPQPQGHLADVSAQLVAVQKEMADVRRRVACLVLVASD